MTPLVSIIGPTDRRLEDTVRACGLRTGSMPGALETLTLGQTSEEEPDIVLVDVRGASNLPSSLAATRAHYPRAAFVLLASSLDPMLMLEGMRAGVTECVAEPITQASLGEALTRVLAQRGGYIGEVFAFVGAKGGVGTTTLAVNVAATLAASGSALVIDFNPCFGDAGVLLSAEPRFSVFDALDNTHRLDQSFFTSLAVPTTAGPWLLPSPQQPASQGFDPSRVRLLLEFVARNYRYTILDIPRTCRAVLESLSSATSTVVVTTQELASVKAASTLADMLRRRYGREKTSVVVSRYDRNAEIAKDDVEIAVHGDVRFLLPNDYPAALEAQNLGQPLTLANGSKLAASMKEFAAILGGGVKPEENAPAAIGSLMGRLSGLRWKTT